MPGLTMQARLPGSAAARRRYEACSRRICVACKTRCRMLINCSHHPDFDHHEAVHAFEDKSTGLRAFVAIHRFGPLGLAGGGCRMRVFPDEAAALRDVLRLSRAMSYKLALADVPAGGAKCVAIGDPVGDKSENLLLAMGRAIHSLEGRFVAGADVGIDSADLDVMARETPYVERGRNGRDIISEGTAEGARWAIRRAAEQELNVKNLHGVHVAIQGLGKVGSRLSELLAQDGALLSISDIRSELAVTLAHRLGAKVVPPDQLLTLKADIVAPCALGDVLDEQCAEALSCRIVAGPANNQLRTHRIAERLRERNIVYVPDFVAGMGAALAGAEPHACATSAQTEQLTEKVALVVGEVLEEARQLGISPQLAAIGRTERILAERTRSRQSLQGRLAAAAFQRLWRSPSFAEQALRGRTFVEGLRSRMAGGPT